MRRLSRSRSLLAAAALVLAGCQTAGKKPATFAEAARVRPDVTIVVTDSGLGGLSVVAELAARLPASGIARSARIVFVNALLDDAIGYNDLKHEADKLRVFDAALDCDGEPLPPRPRPRRLQHALGLLRQDGAREADGTTPSSASSRWAPT